MLPLWMGNLFSVTSHIKQWTMPHMDWTKITQMHIVNITFLLSLQFILVESIMFETMNVKQ